MTWDEVIVLILFFIVAMFLSVLTEFLLIVSRSLWIAASWSTIGLMVSAGVDLGFMLLRRMTKKVMTIPNERMSKTIMIGMK